MLTPYVPSDRSPWNVQRIVHLFRRSAFGATWNEVQWSLKVGYAATMQAILSGQLPSRLEANSSTTRISFDDVAKRLADTATSTNHASKLQVAWLCRILYSPDPLAEQLTLMWHNHFATSQLKVQNVGAMWGQNQIFRDRGRAPFADLLGAVVRDPATLVWLDAQLNSKTAPNENLARELLELFTLGVGNYTEQDVKETARVLTGRTIVDGTCFDDQRRHDGSNKTILGQESSFTPDDLVPLLATHPATARRIAWRICEHFLGEDIATERQIDDLAVGLKENEMRTEWAVETVLRSEVFFSNQTMGQRITPPVTSVVSIVRGIQDSRKVPSLGILVDWIAEMGQDLFFPPNVGGWRGGRSWLSPQRWIARLRFAEVIAAQPKRNDLRLSTDNLARLLVHQTPSSPDGPNDPPNASAPNELRQLLSQAEAHVD